MESGFHNAANTGNGTVSPSVLLQLHQPQLGIRGFDIPDFAVPEVFFLHKVEYEVVSHLGGIPDTLFQTDIAFQQFQNSHIPCVVIHADIDCVVDFLFLGTKLFQSRCVNGTPFARYILITVLICKIFALLSPVRRTRPFLSFLFADIVKLLSTVERPEFDKAILSYPSREFHRNILISVTGNRPAPDISQTSAA